MTIFGLRFQAYLAHYNIFSGRPGQAEAGPAIRVAAEDFSFREGELRESV